MTAHDQLIEEILSLKKERNALILAHNYQNDEVQDISDFIGDSFALSRISAESDAQVIVFCGVHFMAESAVILSPQKTVLLPVLEAGCPMAEMAEIDEVLAWKKRYPQAAVVSYINSSAAVKAVSDICCTSANAVNVIQSLENEEIIFLPDQNLGSYVAGQVPEKTVRLWPGYCLTHHQVSPEEVKQVKAAHPEAEVLIHPECRPEVTALADYVGSTSQISKRVSQSKAASFIIDTEMGIMHGLKQEHPHKQFYLLTPGLVCPNMKKITLPDVLNALKTLQPVISVPEPIRAQAHKALERMLAIKS